MGGDIYFSGYASVCSSVAENVNRSCIRDKMQERPHLRPRIAKLQFHEFRTPDINCPNAATFECAYAAMPDYSQGYTGHIPKNLWTICENHKEQHKSSRFPVQAYPSEYGSPCLDNYCKTSCCVLKDSRKKNVRYGDYGTEGYLCSQVCGEYLRKQKTSQDEESKTCCSSCSKGGSCEGKGNYPKSYSRYQIEGEVEIIPFRKGGVVPNYMGHIPGMHMAFGESYGITANRLLNRHFSDMGSRQY